MELEERLTGEKQGIITVFGREVSRKSLEQIGVTFATAQRYIAEARALGCLSYTRLEEGRNQRYVVIPPSAESVFRSQVKLSGDFIEKKLVPASYVGNDLEDVRNLDPALHNRGEKIFPITYQAETYYAVDDIFRTRGWQTEEYKFRTSTSHASIFAVSITPTHLAKMLEIDYDAAMHRIKRAEEKGYLTTWVRSASLQHTRLLLLPFAERAKEILPSSVVSSLVYRTIKLREIDEDRDYTVEIGNNRYMLIEQKEADDRRREKQVEALFLFYARKRKKDGQEKTFRTISTLIADQQQAARSTKNVCDYRGFSDNELGARVREGDLVAYQEAYTRYSPLVRRIVSSIIQDHANAEDAAQDVLVRLYTVRESYGDGNYRGWLSKIAKNYALNYLRFLKKRSWTDITLFGESIDGKQPDLLDIITAKEQQEAVQIGLEKLSEEHRVILQLRYESDMNYAEIAAHLKLKLGTVMSRLYRAKDSLLEQMAS